MDEFNGFHDEFIDIGIKFAYANSMEVIQTFYQMALGVRGDEQLEQFITDLYNTAYAIGHQEAYADVMRSCTQTMVQISNEINEMTGLNYNDYEEDEE